MESSDFHFPNPCKPAANIILTLTTATLLAAGCTAPPVRAYKGPERPACDIATLRGELETKHKFLVGINKRVQILKVDKKTTYNILDALVNAPPKTVQLLPGKHDVFLKFEQYDRFAYGKVWFIALAGRSYRVKSETRGYGVCFWIEDEATGLPVGGIKGSVDEPEETRPPNQ